MARKQAHWSFADTTERDAVTALGVVQDGDLATIQATGAVQKRVSGAWQDVGGSGGGGAQDAGLPLNNLVSRVDIGDIGSYVGSGSTVVDLEGGLQDGTITGATYKAAALFFDGVSGNVVFPKNGTMDDVFAGGGTVIVLVMPHDQGGLGTGTIISTADSSYANGWTLHVRDVVNYPTTGNPRTMNVGFKRGFSGGTPGDWKTNDLETNALRPLQVGRWSTVAVTYDDSSSSNVPTIYVDGVQQGVTTVAGASGSAQSDAGRSLYMGEMEGGARTFEGGIAVVLAWDRVLDAQEIADVHAVLVGRGASYVVGSLGLSLPTGIVHGGEAGLIGGTYVTPSSFGHGGAVRVLGGDSLGTGNAGMVFVHGGDSVSGYAGGVEVKGGRGVTDPGSEFGGCTLTGGNHGVLVTFRGTDNEGTGNAGDVLVRAGDCPAGTGSGVDSGGDLVVRGGLARGNTAGGQVVIRSGGPPTTATSATTGDITITTQTTNDPTGIGGTFGGTFTQTGNITITTGPAGSAASSTGNIDILAGDKGGSGGVAGSVRIFAGDDTSGANNQGAGSVIISAGEASGGSNTPGGDVLISAGGQTGASGTGSAGSVQIFAGQQSGSGAPGLITFSTDGAGRPMYVRTWEVTTTDTSPSTFDIDTLNADGEFLQLELDVTGFIDGGLDSATGGPSLRSRHVVTVVSRTGGALSFTTHIDDTQLLGAGFTWLIDLTASGTTVRLSVQGETGKTVNWVATIRARKWS